MRFDDESGVASGEGGRAANRSEPRVRGRAEVSQVISSLRQPQDFQLSQSPHVTFNPGTIPLSVLPPSPS